MWEIAKNTKDAAQEFDVNGDEAQEDLANLQRMFPRLDHVAIKAVYRGFAGNYETAVEMLHLAMAEERER